METENKKVLAIVPARGGSKGVPNKNIRDLGGKPLISHIIETAQASVSIDKLILSTDDSRIIEAGKALGVEVPFKRPDSLAGDNVQIVTVIKYIYDHYKQKGEHYDAVLSIQPTCPFTSVTTINEMIGIWKDSGADSVTTIAEITQGHPYIAKSFSCDSHRIDPFCEVPEDQVGLNRRHRKKAYFLTGGIYLRDKRLLEQAEVSGHCLGENTKAVIVDDVEAVDINTEIDFKFAESLINAGMVK